MIIRTYVVDDMKEAVIRAKYELGDDAIIINQREIKVGKWYNPFKKKALEVTVAVEDDSKVKVQKPADKPLANEVEDSNDPLIDGPFVSNPQKDEPKSKLSKQIDLYCKLLQKDRDHLTLEEKKGFVELVMKDNPLNNELSLGKLNVLVGPTGVGKTTTIAKLAATEYLVNNKKVGLITIDTYRIGAVEQLRTYANILGIDFEVANNPDELKEKVEGFIDCDIILIDTLGTSPKDIKKLEEIKDNIRVIDENINTYLVISMSTDKDTMESILERYKYLNYDALILTKIDEVSSISNLWFLVENYDTPIQYFCHGQDVPDDIKLATVNNIFDYCKENDLDE